MHGPLRKINLIFTKWFFCVCAQILKTYVCIFLLSLTNDNLNELAMQNETEKILVILFRYATFIKLSTYDFAWYQLVFTFNDDH